MILNLLISLYLGAIGACVELGTSLTKPLIHKELASMSDCPCSSLIAKGEWNHLIPICDNPNLSKSLDLYWDKLKVEWPLLCMPDLWGSCLKIVDFAELLERTGRNISRAYDDIGLSTGGTVIRYSKLSWLPWVWAKRKGSSIWIVEGDNKYGDACVTSTLHEAGHILTARRFSLTKPEISGKRGELLAWCSAYTLWRELTRLTRWTCRAKLKIIIGLESYGLDPAKLTDRWRWRIGI